MRDKGVVKAMFLEEMPCKVKGRSRNNSASFGADENDCSGPEGAEGLCWLCCEE